MGDNRAFNMVSSTALDTARPFYLPLSSSNCLFFTGNSTPEEAYFDISMEFERRSDEFSD